MSGPDGSISVSSGSMDEQARNLADIKNEIERALLIAKKQIKNLEESGAFKTKNAGTSFQVKYEEWDTSAAKTVALMADFGDYLKKTGAAFDEVDAAYSI